MPSRIWSNEKNDWIVIDDLTDQAYNVEVLDAKGYYKNPKLDEDNNPIDGEFSDEFLSVEKCLEKIGDKMNSGDIGAIGEIKDKVNDLDDRVTEIEENGVGGGGSGANMPVVKLMSENYYAIPTDGEVSIYYSFTSPNLGFGTAYISIDYNTVETTAISQGSNAYTVKNLEKGEHRLDIYVTDITGLFSNTITVTIVAGGLELTSSFDDSTDISLEDYIKIRYNISTISSTAIEVSIEIDGQLTKTEGIIGQNILDIGQFTSLGVHTVKISAVSGDLVSNVLLFNLVVADANNLYVSTTFPSPYDIQVGKNLQIDYRNSMLGQNRFITHFFIDGVEVDTVTSYLGYNFWNVGTNLEIGPHTLLLYSTTADEEYISKSISWVINVVSEDYVPFKVVTDSLLCSFDANGKQQTSSTKNIWNDESGNGVRCELFNFNYSTNGWIDNTLTFNGKTYAKIDMSPFSENIQNGITIDILYKVKNVGDIDGKVVWCKNPVTPYQGFYINTYEANMRSANSRMVSNQFQDDTWTRVTWVINREDLTMICYVNAIITKCIYITDIENFRLDKEIYLGASFDEVDDNLDSNGNPIPHYASCAIKTFRIYDRPLTDEEVLQNHIADIKNKEEQLAIRELNYGDSTIPIIKFEGNVEGMTGDIYKYLTIDYTDPLDPSKRFRQEQCIVKWQGTSSLEYPVKNYTIELRNGGNVWEYAPKDNWIPEKRYTLKANFMDSSGYNNIGSAKLIYDYFRKSNMFYPQEIKNPKTRSVVDGFPVKLYVNGESKGIYMFNIDRYAENNYGFAGEQAVVSYEIGVNSVSGAGAFANDTWSSIRSEFEMRYHYGGDESVVCETITIDGEPTTVLKAGYHSELQNLVSWVCNSTIEEFRSELKEHFELNFLIDYYLWVIMLGLVDNLGKNMVLTTFGMNGEGNVIWYPSLYD